MCIYSGADVLLGSLQRYKKKRDGFIIVWVSFIIIHLDSNQETYLSTDYLIQKLYTRIEFFRKNYREIHGNQRIPKFPGIFTVFTVIFTGNHDNFYRNSR